MACDRLAVVKYQLQVCRNILVIGDMRYYMAHRRRARWLVSYCTATSIPKLASRRKMHFQKKNIDEAMRCGIVSFEVVARIDLLQRKVALFCEDLGLHYTHPCHQLCPFLGYPSIPCADDGQSETSGSSFSTPKRFKS